MGQEQLHDRPGFLDLPAVIRITIYGLALPNSRYVLAEECGRYDHLDVDDYITQEEEAGIERTCYQIRDECLSYLFQGVELRFSLARRDVQKYVRWLTLDGATVLPQVKRLVIWNWQHYYEEYTGGHPMPCQSDLDIDLNDERAPVKYVRSWSCHQCFARDDAVDRVGDVVRRLARVDGRRRLTTEKLWEIFNTAAWW